MHGRHAGCVPLVLVFLAVLGAGAEPYETLAPWGANRHPTDARKRHVEEIASGRHSYVIRQEGTMDGDNCRAPIGVGMMDGPAIEQTWESNRAVRLDNVGDDDVVNPWLSNGRNAFRTLDSICLAGLWRRAGLKVTPARLVGHCVSQAFFDGRWNLFDGDMHSMYLVRDHDLIKRSHTQGILNPDKLANDEWEASIYIFDGPPAGDRDCAKGTSMNMVLRPGESIVWRWGHANPVKYHGSQPRYPDTISNGLGNTGRTSPKMSG